MADAAEEINNALNANTLDILRGLVGDSQQSSADQEDALRENESLDALREEGIVRISSCFPCSSFPPPFLLFLPQLCSEQRGAPIVYCCEVMYVYSSYAAAEKKSRATTKAQLSFQNREGICAGSFRRKGDQAQNNCAI